MIIQQGVLSQLGLGAVGNLLMVLVVIATVSEKFEYGLLAAIIAGIVLDLASASRDGTMVICMLVVTTAVYFTVNTLLTRREDWMILVSSVSMGTIVFMVAFILISKLFAILHLGQPADTGFILGRKLLLDLVVNLILTYPVYWLYNKSKKLETKLA